MPVMNLPAGNSRDFDVVVIGGAISGEATAEVSSFFLTRVLGLTNFLARTRISKNGLRFWFYSDSDGRLADCTELGGKYLTTVPAQLIDRSVLDEEMLRRAITKGAELIRPAQMKSVALQEGGLQEILLNHEGGEKPSEPAGWSSPRVSISDSASFSGPSVTGCGSGSFWKFGKAGARGSAQRKKQRPRAKPLPHRPSPPRRRAFVII